jgi:hypothetical protein
MALPGNSIFPVVRHSEDV